MITLSPRKWRRRVPGWSLFRAIAAWGFVRGSASLYFRFFHGLRVEGLENVPDEGPLVVVSNHVSHFDPPLIGAVVGRRRAIGFMARHTLFQSRWFGGFIRFLGAFPVDREGRGSDAMREAIHRIEMGHAGLVFPEGTRQTQDAVGDFKPGFLLLVRRTGARVLPVAIDGTFQAWPKGAKRPRPFTRIRLIIGEPIPAETLEGMGGQAASNAIRERIIRLKERAEAEG